MVVKNTNMAKKTYQAVLDESIHELICKKFGYGLERGSFSKGVREMYTQLTELENTLKKVGR